MSHHIYHTDSFIIGDTPLLRSSKLLQVFTRDFGLISARAQGIRETRSKLRFHLQDLSRLHISLVRGRAGWHVVGACMKFNVYKELKNEPIKLQSAARVFNLLHRLLRGEESNPELFNTVSLGIEYLAASDLSSAAVSIFEAILVLRILHNLGYVADSPSIKIIIAPSAYWGDDLIARSTPHRRLLIRLINKALTESQL